MVDRKKPGIDQDLAKLGAGRKPSADSSMGSRPGQMHSETLTAGPAGYAPFSKRPAMSTIYAGHPGARRPVMSTIYAGHPGTRLPVMDTIYAGGHPGSRLPVMNTVYGGGHPGSRASSGNTVFAPGYRGSQILTRQVTNPFTRQPETVSYNIVTGLYLDKSLNRWLPAPPWISAQFRR